MMKMFRIIIAFFFMMDMNAQDIHFSQYHNFPLMINPAYTGNFNGAMRVAAIYRNQWFTIPSSQFGTYQTYGIAVDGSLMKKNLDPDKFSIGLTMYRDQAGSGSLTSNEALISIAYFKSMDRYRKSGLSLGLQGGIVAKGVNILNLTFESQAQDFGFNTSIFNGEPTLIGKTFIYPDFNIGAMWQHEATEYVSYYMGGSIYHIGEPNETFNRDSNNYIPRRFNFNAGVDFNINDEMTISPSVLYMQQATASQLNIGATFKYNFIDDFIGYALLRYRGWSDAFIFGIGGQKGSFRGTVSYDITTSNLSNANNGQGGIEISLVYIYKSESDKRRRRDQFCPSF